MQKKQTILNKTIVQKSASDGFSLDSTKHIPKKLHIIVQMSGRLDLNQRPLAPHASTLPDCATPRLIHDYTRPYSASDLGNASLV